MVGVRDIIAGRGNLPILRWLAPLLDPWEAIAPLPSPVGTSRKDCGND